MTGSPETPEEREGDTGRPSISERARRRLGALSPEWAGRRPFVAAAALSAVWLGGVLAYGAGFFGLFESARLAPHAATALEIALFVLAALAPVTLFVHGAFLAVKAEEIRVAAARVSRALESMAETPVGTAMDPPPAVEPAAPEVASAAVEAARGAIREETGAIAAEVAETLSRLDASMAEIRAVADRLDQRAAAPPAPGPVPPAETAPRKVTASPPAADRAQPALPFGADAPAPVEGVPWESVVRALDFPKDERDREGFAAIRQVVADRTFAELLQASEDTLSLLAEEGLYMEDLIVEHGSVADWIRYADGTRGGEVSSIAGILDEPTLDSVRARLKKDAVFRDAALHFMRRYDRVLRRMTEELGPDPLIIETADSRTGRAYMIVARVTGAFD